MLCLADYPSHTLLLLENFDDVQLRYNREAENKRVKDVVDFALSMPNGIITSRSDAVPK